MKRLGGVWEKVVDIDNLRRSFQKAAKGRRDRKSVQRIEANLEHYLIKLQAILKSGTYHTSTYRTRVIFEPKRRVIYILPFFPDRIVHHAVMDVIGPYLNNRLDKHIHSAIKGRGQVSGSTECMKLVRKYKYVLKCDISKFYPSIDHDIMMRIVERKIKDKRVLSLLDEIIRSSNTVPGEIPGKNLPIGSYVSQGLCNMYMNPLDTYIRQVLGCKGYIRYCDDFVLFSDDKQQLREWAGLIEDFLDKELKLRLSKCLLFPVRQGVDFLGYRHFPDYILVRKRTAQRIKRRVFHIADGLKYDVINEEKYRGQLASAWGWMNHANSWNLQKLLQLKLLQGAVKYHAEVQRLCRGKHQLAG